MSNDLTKGEALQRFTYLSNWAKESYDLVARALDKGSVDPSKAQEVKYLIEATLTAAADAERLKNNINYGKHYPQGEQHEIGNIDDDHPVLSKTRTLGEKYKIDFDSTSNAQCWRARMYHVPSVGPNADFFYRNGTNAACIQEGKCKKYDGPYGLVAAGNCAPVRCCFTPPNQKTHTIFFVNNGCVEIETKPGSNDDTIVRGPEFSLTRWSCLQKLGFYAIDAALPHPTNENQVYLFSGFQYARIDIAKNEIISGPDVIIKKWASLMACNFTTVDAILPLASTPGRAYFFKGDYYALIEIQPGTADDKVITGPKIIKDKWPSLQKAGFTTVDAVMPHPSHENEAYFFSGENYARVSFTPGSNDDTLVDGPKLVSKYWPSLRQAFFY